MSDASRDVDVEQFAREHLVTLYRIAVRLTGSASDAEDLVQQVFVVAHSKLHQLRDPARALAWLVRILRRERIRLGQQKQIAGREVVSLDSVPEPFAPDDETDDPFEPERVLRELARMPEEFREPLVLFYFEELKYRDIAEALECPIGTVMSRLARGKIELRRRLGLEIGQPAALPATR